MPSWTPISAKRATPCITPWAICAHADEELATTLGHRPVHDVTREEASGSKIPALFPARVLRGHLPAGPRDLSAAGARGVEVRLAEEEEEEEELLLLFRRRQQRQ